MLWLFPALALATPLHSWDFETGEDGFSPSTGLQFEWGTFGLLPADPSDGSAGWATQIDAHYLNDASDTLAFPFLDLTDASRPILSMLHWFTIEDSDWGDSARLEARHDGAWIRLSPVYGYPSENGFAGASGSWRTDWFDLSGLGPSPELRLAFVSGLSTSFPGWYVDQISIEEGDPVPPLFLNVEGPADTTDLIGPYAVTATVIDDFSFPQLTLFWSTETAPSTAITMSAVGDGLYMAEIPGQPAQTTVNWWIEATDGSNVTAHPDTGTAEFRVALPAPKDLVGLDLLSEGRIAASTLSLHWTPPEGEFTVTGYAIDRDDEHIASTSETSAIVPLKSGLQALRVSAVFETSDGAVSGDASAPLWVDAALPYIDSLAPKQGWPGDRLRIDLRGDNLYLDATDVSLEPGSGISVETLSIIDTNHIRALIAIDATTDGGPRQLYLQTGDTEVRVQPEFQVLVDGSRPQVVAARPPTVRQGAHTTVFIDLGAMPDDAQHSTIIDIGEGIFVESVYPRSTGYDVALVVAANAPLGNHAITVDNGDRLLTGASLEVLDNRLEAQGGCATPRVRPRHTLWILGFFLLCVRRQSR
jgi:hypothetical protein